MEIKELRLKTKENLERELPEAVAHLKELLFKRSANQLKNVREIRATRKTIARINTLLSH